MDHFHYRKGRLLAEEVALEHIAETYGTPCYVYSRATLERHWRAFDRALAGHDHLVCYAVKANANLAVLDVLARLGSGFDIVSEGELHRVLAAGGEPRRVIFSGVAKGEGEIRRALACGIGCFNVESAAELGLIAELAAAAGVHARVALRVNPDVDPRTHPYIATGLRETKFGIPIQEAPALYRRAASMPHVEPHGVDCHIGSQLTSLSPFVDALDRVLRLVDDLAEAGVCLRHVNVGGGLGVRYHEEQPPEPDAYARALRERLGARELKLLVEPGRAIAGNAGVLLTRVRYLKRSGDKHFALVDAGMNDLLRPALYDAWHDVVPVRLQASSEARTYDVVGPVCETGDFLARGRTLDVRPGSLLAIRTAGAYGFVMSSNYNSRPRAAEVMVDGARAHLVRARESMHELYAGESTLPE
ncbi:MAG: diaminopimelate decarboxylase [Gammaproteobacteria bacterium]|nr:diaminopimelate decarboxylase [Gammaproteobacteria bacterium]NIR83313.1 diaminopimelate decarboxylase [Gammaproteobacteria bacterium]NIR91113.1 diaminopimelate decarboxylase [Gammaproteobacteria bacterium]NIU04480.1 diaminopimelate decarboxylase [Gammaproteobacteria bacterium]NIW87116.1 diaminopimelate decarboxylase [Gammaproteobacteria bacterium]